MFPKYGAVIQVNGCFWHAHQCALFKMPETRQQFWAAKLAANTARDARSTQALHDLGWRVLVVWECALKGPARLPLVKVIAEAKAFVTGLCRDHVIPAPGAHGANAGAAAGPVQRVVEWGPKPRASR